MNTTANLKIFLLAVLLVQFGSPITLYGRLWIGAYILMQVAMVLFGILTVRAERQPVAPVLILAVAVLTFGAWFSLDPSSAPATLGVNLAVGLFMLSLVLFLLKFIFGERRASELDLILAAVSVYLLMGGVFKSIFVTLEMAEPGSFVVTAAPGQPVAWQQLLYYSYVTLSTLGYGEILPVGAWARSFAVLETVIGPLFLATIVARLVGAYVPRPRDLASGREPRARGEA